MLRRNPNKRLKHGNQPVTIDGVSFQSTIEGARWIELWHMQKRGEINSLTRQVPFGVKDMNGNRIAKYYADFVYFEGDEQVVEDVKGQVLGTFKMKAALLAAEGIHIRIVKARDIAKWARDTAIEIRDTGIPYSLDGAA